MRLREGWAAGWATFISKASGRFRRGNTVLYVIFIHMKCLVCVQKRENDGRQLTACYPGPLRY